MSDPIYTEDQQNNNEENNTIIEKTTYTPDDILQIKAYIPRGCTVKITPENKDNQVCYKHGCNKLNSYDWLSNIKLPHNQIAFDCVEVRFKNSRKDFYRITDGLELKTGDIVAVEASPGHDIGIITLTGEVVKIQMAKKGVNPKSQEIKKVYRKAKAYDIEKWCAAIELEESTMFKARELAHNLGLSMKISDVEYQGDKTKAIFHYTADDRVDFRELIKQMAEVFSIRVEMKQIGVRQEASRLGGIGACGRELCCSTWLTSFSSVSTNAARMQQLSLNPNKLAGQCSKLKCCLNYEYNFYEEALQQFPEMDTVLITKKGKAFHQKSDVFKKLMWYTYQNDPNNFIPVHIDDVKDIIAKNKKGEIPAELTAHKDAETKSIDYHNVDEQDNLYRFDNK